MVMRSRKLPLEHQKKLKKLQLGPNLPLQLQKVQREVCRNVLFKQPPHAINLVKESGARATSASDSGRRPKGANGEIRWTFNNL